MRDDPEANYPGGAIPRHVARGVHRRQLRGPLAPGEYRARRLCSTDSPVEASSDGGSLSVVKCVEIEH